MGGRRVTVVAGRGARHLAERMRSTRLMVFDFDGVLTDDKVYVFADGSEAVRCHRGDGIGLGRLRKAGVQTVILSSEVNPIVRVRSRKLRTRCIHGCADKLAALEALGAELGIGWDEIGFLGNDINDLPCLRRVGLPIVVRDAHPDLRGLALYRTRAGGGEGAVREVCDLLLQAREPGDER